MIAAISGLVIAILGAFVLYYGVQLATLGGSMFYILMGAGLLISGILVLLRRRSGLSVYALLLVLTLVWTIWEVGFDKWQWIPRGALIAAIGFWLALPFVARGLRPQVQRPLWRGHHAALSGVIGVLIAITIGLCFYDPFPTHGEIKLAQAAGTPAQTAEFPDDDWTAYGGNNFGQRYSSLQDINVDNISQLKLAWSYNTGDLRQSDDAKEYTFEATPLKVNNTLYFCTPHNRVIALDPATGAERWKFDPGHRPDHNLQHQTCRGVSYHDSGTTPDQVCSKRVITATVDARLIALDADTGKPCEAFGDKGSVDLTEGMPSLRPASYMQTSPPLVTKDLIILGGSIIDNAYVSNPSGVTRAYDIQTGDLVWKFDAGKPEDTRPLAPGEQYEPGSPGSWTIFSADEALGLVYVPLGNKSPDPLGADRTANDEKYTDALVALDIATGRPRWEFRTSYHDLWDRDNPSQPSLINLPKNGEDVPAIVIPTKGGNLFVLDRRDGTPVLPINEIQVSTKTDVPNEKPSPTQPVSSLNFTPPPLREADMWGVSPLDQLACRIEYKKRRYDGNPFTPPTMAGSLVYPGNIGVFNWGSVAVDPVNQLMIGTPVRLAYLYDVVKRPDADTRVVTQDDSPPFNENFGGSFAISIQHFRSSLSLPCQAPPWGTMVGVNLATGETVWTRRNGTTRDQVTPFLPFPFPIPFPMGIISHGGPLITAGGVSFAAATLDNYLRAYDIRNGQEIWKTRLPAGGQATPMTYRADDDKQYVLIASGGHGAIGSTAGDAVRAYRLE